MTPGRTLTLRPRWALLGVLALGCAAPLNADAITDHEGVVRARVCPSDPGCADAAGELRVGVARRTITPRVEAFDDLNGDGRWSRGEPFEDVDGDGVWDPVWIAGFDPGRAATGVHDETWARALSISRGSTRLGIVALDVLGMSHDDVLRLRGAARDAGLDFDHVAVIATHTHESQDPLGFGGAHLLSSGYDAEYNARLIARSVEALAEALERERAASIEHAVTQTPGLIADSREPAIIDDALNAFRFVASDRSTVATLVVWGNHAEALGGANTQVSSDYPHYLREALEARYEGSTAIYIPGALGGLMNPLDVVGCPDERGAEGCATGTFEKARFIGEGAAAAAIGALETAATAQPDRLEIRVAPVLMPVRTPELLGGVQIGVLERDLFTSEGRAYDLGAAPTAPLLPLHEIAAGRVVLQSEVNALRLGDTTLLLLGGELYPELWLDDAGESRAERRPGADYPFAPAARSFRSLIPEGAHPVIVNQANDSLGYVLPRSQWDRLPPHTYGEAPQYGEGVSVGSHAAGVLRRACEALFAR